MLINVNRVNDAHDLLKQSLVSQNSNLNLRAFYTHFLIQSNSPKIAKDFVFATLKDHDKHDVYSLCASGWIMYHQSRESRDVSSTGIEERKRGFQRCAEFYDKALQLDPSCAFAAQGLAIVTAEDALGTLGGALTLTRTPGVDEGQKRIQNAREALDIFVKVRESINDGSVYFNIGHCYYARDEFDRAIESVSLIFFFDLKFSLVSHDYDYLVRDSFNEVLRRTQCRRTSLSLSLMVCQVYQGSVFPGNEDCVEICTGREYYDPLISQLLNM